MTHICVNKLTIIGSDNGLLPGRRQAIIWTNSGILLIGPLGTNFGERPSCLGFNVLTAVVYRTQRGTSLNLQKFLHLHVLGHQQAQCWQQKLDIDGLAHACIYSIANALGLPQSCTKPLIWFLLQCSAYIFSDWVTLLATSVFMVLLSWTTTHLQDGISLCDWLDSINICTQPVGGFSGRERSMRQLRQAGGLLKERQAITEREYGTMKSMRQLNIGLYQLRVNSLWPRDAIWWHRSGSTLAQVMACCLMAPSHYLNQYWLILSAIQWHSSQNNFTRDTFHINHQD